MDLPSVARPLLSESKEYTYSAAVSGGKLIRRGDYTADHDCGELADGIKEMTLAPGTKLGPYEILAPIGSYHALLRRIDI